MPATLSLHRRGGCCRRSMFDPEYVPMQGCEDEVTIAQPKGPVAENEGLNVLSVPERISGHCPWIRYNIGHREKTDRRPKR